MIHQWHFSGNFNEKTFKSRSLPRKILHGTNILVKYPRQSLHIEICCFSAAIFPYCIFDRELIRILVSKKSMIDRSFFCSRVCLKLFHMHTCSGFSGAFQWSFSRSQIFCKWHLTQGLLLDVVYICKITSIFCNAENKICLTSWNQFKLRHLDDDYCERCANKIRKDSCC
jgi:hypothetical protein